MNETGIWTGILNKKLGKFKFIYVEIIVTNNIFTSCNLQSNRITQRSKSYIYLLLSEQIDQLSFARNKSKSSPELALCFSIETEELEEQKLIKVRISRMLIKLLVSFQVLKEAL